MVSSKNGSPLITSETLSKDDAISTLIINDNYNNVNNNDKVKCHLTSNSQGIEKEKEISENENVKGD